MYTLEEKLAVIKVYIQSGLSESAVFNQFGYPSPNSLRQWYKQYQENGERLPVREGKYSQETIREVIAYYQTHGQSVAKTSKAFGYPYSTVSDMIKKSACPMCEHGVKWTPEQKASIVQDMIESGQPAYLIAAKYGISRTALNGWRRQLLGKEQESMKQRTKKPPKKADTEVETCKTLEEYDTRIAEKRQELLILEKEVAAKQLRYDVLEAAEQIIKKEKGISIENLSNREKAGVIDALKEKHQLKALLRMVGMAKSSYFYQHAAMKKNNKDAAIRGTVHQVFTENAEIYGYRRIYLQMKNIGIRCSEKIVRRIMKCDGLHVRNIRRKKYSSYVGEVSPAVENVINRDFHAEEPNKKWLTDISEFSLPRGKVYLSPMIDCFDGMPVAWSISTSPNAELANSMLDKAIQTLKPGEHPVVHSDRGGHYRWTGWIEKMEKAHLTRSMSRKACSPDNAACEGFFGRIKNEMFYGRDWRDTDVDAFIDILQKYLEWFCSKRIKLRLGGMSPIQYRESKGYSVPGGLILSPPPLTERRLADCK